MILLLLAPAPAPTTLLPVSLALSLTVERTSHRTNSSSSANIRLLNIIDTVVQFNRSAYPSEKESTYHDVYQTVGRQETGGKCSRSDEQEEFHYIGVDTDISIQY